MDTTVEVIVIMTTGLVIALLMFAYSWVMEAFASYREYVHACEVEYHIRPMLLLPWLKAGREWV